MISQQSENPLMIDKHPWPLSLENAAEKFLYEMKLMGSVKNVAKKPKELLIEAYEGLFEKGAFKDPVTNKF